MSGSLRVFLVRALQSAALCCCGRPSVLLICAAAIQSCCGLPHPPCLNGMSCIVLPMLASSEAPQLPLQHDAPQHLANIAAKGSTRADCSGATTAPGSVASASPSHS